MALKRNVNANGKPTRDGITEENESKAAEYAAAKEGSRQKRRAEIEAELMRSQADMSSWMFDELDAFDFVWPGFKVGTVGGLIAAGSTGKSYLALELGICVGSAKANATLLKIPNVKPGRVLIFSAEDDYDVTKNRIKAITRYLTKEAAYEVAKNLYVRKFPAKVSTDISDDSFREDLVEWARGCRLVIFDTFNKFSGDKNENDNAEMGLLIKKYFEVAEESGAAVLILHHSGKSSSREGRQDEQESARGAGAITANMRWQGYMQKMTKDEWALYRPGQNEHDRKKYVRWGGNKENYGSDTPDAWLQRDENGVLLPVDIGPMPRHNGSNKTQKASTPTRQPNVEKQARTAATNRANKAAYAESLRGLTDAQVKRQKTLKDEEWKRREGTRAEPDTQWVKTDPEAKTTRLDGTRVGEDDYEQL
jgi:RecA-family ATPase